jgi:hypothetical protein
MRWIVLPSVLLLLTGAGAGYGDIDAPRDTDPLTLAKAFCAARTANGDMSALIPYYAPKLQRVLADAAGPIPWQSRDLTPDSCEPEVLYGQDNIVGVLVRLTYTSGHERWADTLNFQRTPTTWLLNNVLYESGGNLRFRLFED